MKPLRPLLAAAVLAALAPVCARADRGALSLDAGALLSATRIGPGFGRAADLTGSLAGASVGVRYALQNYLEITAEGFWLEPVRYYWDGTTVLTPNGAFLGQAQSRVGRWGGALGVRWVTGMVFRLYAGFELGFERLGYTDPDLVNTAQPLGARSFGLPLADRAVSGVALAPLVGLEWTFADHASISISPRLEFLPSASMTAITVPVTLSWSVYGWPR